MSMRFDASIDAKVADVAAVNAASVSVLTMLSGIL